MFFVLGGNMSFISTLATKMEQIMCRLDSQLDRDSLTYDIDL